MTINYSQASDLIVPSNSDTYRGLSGDDVYILSKGLSSNAKINIVDTSGTIQYNLLMVLKLTKQNLLRMLSR